MVAHIFSKGVSITSTTSILWRIGWSSHIILGEALILTIAKRWLGVGVKGNNGQGDGDEDGVVQISFTGSHNGCHFTCQKVQVCMFLLRGQRD